jgi:hypothetical protein
MASMAASAVTQAASSTRPLPPVGMVCRIMTAAAPTARTGGGQGPGVERVLADLADDQQD